VESESCGFCQGKGFYTEHSREGKWTNIACEVCEGDGIVAVSDTHVKCGICYGRGWMFSYHAGFFPHLEGATPFEMLPRERKTCQVCNGTGWISVKASSQIKE
jgi:DnaJ-class molecular chaperone